jgi:hypothetical protein
MEYEFKQLNPFDLEDYANYLCSDSIRSAKSAVQYMLRGARYGVDVATGVWFRDKRGEIDGDEEMTYDDGPPSNDAEIAALRAFAKKTSKLSACAEGLMYLGAPFVAKADEAIYALSSILHLVDMGDINEVNDRGFKRCPTLAELETRFTGAISHAVAEVKRLKKEQAR